MNKKAKNILSKIIIQIIFIFFGISIIFSFYYLIVNSFKTELEFAASQLSLPKSMNFDNLVHVWNEGNMNIAFKNSVILSFSTVVLTTIVGILGAYAFAFMKFKIKKGLYISVISTMFFSPMIIVIPLLIQFNQIGLGNTYLGTITVYTGTRLAFSIFLLTTFFRGINTSIIEAATIDGANRLGTIKNIIIPMAKPVLFSLILLNFNGIWNELLIGLLFLQSKEQAPLMAAITKLSSNTMSTPTYIFASLLIATIPIMILYGFTQKFFIRGMTLGSIK